MINQLHIINVAYTTLYMLSSTISFVYFFYFFLFFMLQVYGLNGRIYLILVYKW